MIIRARKFEIGDFYIMRKKYFKIFTFLLVLLMGFGITSDVKAKETSNQPEDIIISYFNCINEERYIDVQELYGEELNEFVYEFFQDSNNIGEHQGIYNVKHVTSEMIKETGTCEDYEYGECLYSNIKKFFVKCNMNVYQTDKYYQEGVNYFIFYIGMNEDNCLKILNIEIPSYSELNVHDTVEEDIIRFQQIRDELIYGIVSPCYADSPVYIDRVVNPTSIRVEGYDNAIPFWDYCKGVAANEINNLTTDNAARAGAMAIKMYSMHAVNKAASGADYDIKRNQQVYNPNTEISSRAKKAVEYVKNYFL